MAARNKEKIFRQLLTQFSRHQAFLHGKFRIQTDPDLVRTNWLSVNDSRSPFRVSDDLKHLSNVESCRKLLEQRGVLSANRSLLNDIAELFCKTVHIALSATARKKTSSNDYFEVSDHIYEM